MSVFDAHRLRFLSEFPPLRGLLLLENLRAKHEPRDFLADRLRSPLTNVLDTLPANASRLAKPRQAGRKSSRPGSRPGERKGSA